MNLKTVLGLTAVAGLLVIGAPSERAQALSLSNPSAASAAQQGVSAKDVTEVGWHRGGWHRGGWHGGGWHRHGWHRGGWHRRHW
jgi:hypothetical protein